MSWGPDAEVEDGTAQDSTAELSKKVDNTAESHDTLVKAITVDSAVELDTVPL